MQMSTFQRLWQQPKAALCRADTDFSSESPSLLLSRDCVCSSGHMRCPARLLQLSSCQQFAFSPGQIQPVKFSLQQVWPALAPPGRYITWPKLTLCVQSTRGRCPHLNSHRCGLMGVTSAAHYNASLTFGVNEAPSLTAWSRGVGG